ncbi:MAG: energy transducer TonB [Gammaproteobacteria bacterium]
MSACGTAPSQVTPPHFFNLATTPYWMNPTWQAEMFAAVQCVARLPSNAASPAKHGIHATVRFTFDSGAIKDPVIVTSTGNPDLNKLLLQQVVTAKVPKPYGLHTDQPHEFELPLEMFTPYESFQYNVYAAIDRKREYPRDPILQDIMGITTVDFDYLDAKASHIVIIKSSGNKQLDKSSVNAVSKAELPAAPPAYADKTLHMQAIFCYNLNFAQKCPTGNNVIDVEGTRIVFHNVVTY